MVQTEINRLQVNLVVAATNRIEQVFTSGSIADTPMFVAPAPANAPGPYIATMAPNVSQDPPLRNVAVLFLRKNFTPAKIVYQTSKLGPTEIEAPRVDLMGEYVGWTQRKTTGTHIVAFKSVRDPVAQEPMLIADRYPSAYFCDWGEDGNLLCNVRVGTNSWKLICFDRSGREVRTLNTATAPDEGYVATWRKYLHR
jgi:hypothetical protein